MKVMIDISKEAFDRINESPICDHVFDAIDACKAIKSGIPLPDNATTGDVVKALFPNSKVDDTSVKSKVYVDLYLGSYFAASLNSSKDWWNAPYKENKDGADNQKFNR